jgi:hypothetical protein
VSALGQVLVYAGFAVFMIGIIRNGFWRITLADVAADVLMAAGYALVPFLLLAAACGAMAVYLAWRWWHGDNGRRRRRSLAAIGARTRARIAAMAARMRERPARPVLRPVPGAAR